MKRVSLLALVTSLFVAASTGSAHAHPAYKDSSPQSGATVASPPPELWIEFTERIEGGSITITDPCGERADHGEDEMNLTSDRLTTGMHGDKAGTYVVQWSVLGSDGHNTRGEFTFTSSGGAACPGTKEPEREREREREPQPEKRRPGTDEEDPQGSVTNDDDRKRSARERSNDPEREERSRKPRDRVKAEREFRDVAQSPAETTETAAKSIWDGIPIGDFLIALAVAAAIGAAGGRIYAGIIGPRR